MARDLAIELTRFTSVLMVNTLHKHADFSARSEKIDPQWITHALAVTGKASAADLVANTSDRDAVTTRPVTHFADLAARCKRLANSGDYPTVSGVMAYRDQLPRAQAGPIG